MRSSGLAVALALLALTGCVDPEDEGVRAEVSPLDVYRFTYAGADTFVEGVEHGWLLRVANPSSEDLLATILPFGLQEATLGPVTMTAGVAQPVLLPQTVRGGQAVAPPPLHLGPGESGVFLVMVRAYQDAEAGPVGVRVFTGDPDDPVRSFEAITLRWDVTRAAASTPVAPGDHVQTVTVGVWLNGTSFYTNSAELLADPAFPAGFDRAAGDATLLPIYVYNNSRNEQPAGSADSCHFTTVGGYNALLKEQAEGSTGVRLLRPEAAYTVEGREDHLLYGDALVFLNTVVAHDGATGPLDMLPDPTAPCFDPEHATAPLEDVPPTAR